ncbi:hypothetical protein [Campylobacter magnus]|uniref:Uncharacterized protein n=1 Tax=Campylobacter magnus TaxID=3026462 RepID=A0ABT8TDE3_9BACT|nr:hypothetical protein [Campylobacter magnus]MDO2409887.1 hypothetical protein [Campylobacter magnus]
MFLLSIIILASYFVLVLIFSYFWSVVIYKLAISKKIHFIILAIGLYALWGYYTFWDKKFFILSMSGFFLTALYFAAFMFFRKDFSKKLVIFSSFVCVFCLWQLEIPQKVFVSLIGTKINITDNDYVILENQDNFGRKDNIWIDDWVKYKNFLGYMSFYKADILICDELDCKGNKKKIGEISMPSIPRSTLGCINLTGRCLGDITTDYVNSKEFINYLKEQSHKNKQ